MEAILTNIQTMDTKVDKALDKVEKGMWRDGGIGSDEIKSQAMEIHDVAEELLSVISAQLLHGNKPKSLAGLPSSSSKTKGLNKVWISL